MNPSTGLSHVDAEGRAHMVDVTQKAASERFALAEGRILMQPQTLERIVSGDLPKGDVLAVARVAGVQGAKLTAQLWCRPGPTRWPARAWRWRPSRPSAAAS